MWTARRRSTRRRHLLPNGVFGIDVDTQTNDVYVDLGNEIDVYSQGTPTEPAHIDAPSFGSGLLSGYGNDRRHQRRPCLRLDQLDRNRPLGPGDIVPDVTTNAPSIDEIGNTTATVTGAVHPAGGTPDNLCTLEYGPTVAYGSTATCSPDASGANFTADTPGPGFDDRTDPRRRLPLPFRRRQRARPECRPRPPPDRRLRPQGEDAGPRRGGNRSRDPQGLLDPSGQSSSYWFEFGTDNGYGQQTAHHSGVAGSGVQTFGEQITDLPTGKTIHYRIVAENSAGTTWGPDLAFRTASVPEISGIQSSELGPDSATVSAGINPTGYETTYRFEYGASTNYGSVAPADPAPIGAGTSIIDVSQQLTGLTENSTYHFRVVATNKWGSSVGPDTTLDYSPPRCPNDHLRQQTKATYLPDCRAYELVSPASAGPVNFLPSESIWADAEGAQDPYNAEINWTTNRGLGVPHPASPSGVASGSSAVSTRPTRCTTCTWQPGPTTAGPPPFPGLTSKEGLEVSNKECSDSMALCVDHSSGTNFGFKKEGAPYLFRADGKRIGRLPTNLDSVPGGRFFIGEQRMSPDSQPLPLLLDDGDAVPAVRTAARGRLRARGGHDRGRLGLRQRHRRTDRPRHLQTAQRRRHQRRRRRRRTNTRSSSRRSRPTARTC